MAQFLLNSIQFTVDNLTLKPSGAKRVKFGNANNGDFSEASEYGVIPFINAVEIDWNNAYVASSYINNTGEVLSMLQTAYNYATSYVGTVKGINNILPNNNGIVTLDNATTSNNGLMSYADKAKLDGIEDKANKYLLPTANNSKLGGIKTGFTSSGQNYAVKVDPNGHAYVYVPIQEVDLTDVFSRIDSLESQIQSLLENVVYEVSVSLTQCTCADLSNLKTIKPNGGEFNVSASAGYHLPQQITVENATYTWDKSTGNLVLSNVTGNVTVEISSIANLPSSIKICNTSNAEITGTQSITGRTGSATIKVNVESTDGALTANNGKFKFSSIPDGLLVKKGSTVVNTTTLYDNGSQFTITGTKLVYSVSLGVVTNVSNKTDSISVSVVEGGITDISINPSSYKFSTKGEEKEFTVSLTNNMFNVPTTGFVWTIEGTDKDMFTITSTDKTGNTIKVKSSANTDESNSKIAKLKVEYTHNNNKLTSESTMNIDAYVPDVKYYWYVGQENPASMTSISPIVDDNTSPGWRYLGTDLTKYNSSNPIFEGALKYSITFTGRATAYLALPSSTIKLYDDTGYDGVLSDAWTKTGEREINGVKYYIYTSNTTLKAWGADVY